MIYPSGRVVHYLYEAPPVARLISQSEDASGSLSLVNYTYLGMNTIVKESHPQVSGGLTLSHGAAGTYAGWDRFGRIIGQEWRKTDGTLVDGYSYTYDRAGNRTSKGNLVNSAYSETYTYDGLNRLADTNRDGQDLQDWDLDALGNWSGFTDGATSQARTSNAANEISGISGTWIDPTYDAAGNMTSGPKAADETTRLHFVYDGWNRLVQVKADNSGQPGTTTATYGYDGLGRRISNNPVSGTVDYYYNEQYQVLEVRKNGDADAYEQYVYSQRYIDAPVMVYRDTNTDGTVDQKLYVAQDANFNVTATVNGDTGAVVNRFVYTPYGQRTVLSATWTAGTSDFQLGHQGLMLDSETGMYYNRARFYHPTLGRFIQRDRLGYVDGADLYEYAQQNPTSRIDPSGYASRAPSADATAACNKLKLALLKYIQDKPNSMAAKLANCARKRGTLKDQIFDCQSYPIRKVEGVYLPEAKIIILPIELFEGFTEGNVDEFLVDAYMPTIEHELVHAIDAKKKFSEDPDLDRMIREARGWGWAAGAAGNKCDWKRACELAWNSAKYGIFFSKYGGKEDAPDAKKWMDENRDKYVQQCQAAGSKDPALDFGNIPKECES